MSWICPKCETENPDRLKVCEVCDSPREISPVDKLKERLKEKYSDIVYRSFIRYHYELLDSADKGDVNAQYKVGEWFLERGSIGLSDDYSKVAVFWFRNAALKGHKDAQFKLASCYEEGRGVCQIKDEAIKWYKEAANHGDIAAMRRYLGLIYNSKTYEAIIQYEVSLLYSAENGDADSQFLVARWFYNHNSNCQLAYRKETVVWYTKAANKGHCEAMYKLGVCYEVGLGTDCDMSEAFRWYSHSAIKGYKAACLKLAEFYLNGTKVKKDIVAAIKWYNASGTPISKENLCNIGYAYSIGDGVAIDKAKAIEYYRKSADLGGTTALYNLGVCYENGDGVEKSLHEAMYWYEKAADQGYQQAHQCITRIDAKIRSERLEGIIIKLLVYLFFGSVFGAIGYYILTEGLLKLGIHIPEVWPNTFPTNLIICLIIGFIITFKIND